MISIKAKINADFPITLRAKSDEITNQKVNRIRFGPRKDVGR